MKNLTLKIYDDYITALKSKNKISSNILSVLRSKIIEFSKANHHEATDADVIKIIKQLVKSLLQTVDLLKSKNVDPEKYYRELSELDILYQYLPPQMSHSEMEAIVKNLLNEKDSEKKVQFPLIIQHFNNNFADQFENRKLKEIFDNLTK